MKKYIFISICILNYQLYSQEISTDTSIYSFVEIMPEYIGGEKALEKFLGTTIHYPAYAQENEIQGIVYVKFIVEKDGNLSNIKIHKSIHESLDNESLRVIRLMPKWKTGSQNGHPVRVEFIVPVTFQLT